MANLDEFHEFDILLGADVGRRAVWHLHDMEELSAACLLPEELVPQDSSSLMEMILASFASAEQQGL